METQLSLTTTKDTSGERNHPLWSVFQWELRRRLKGPAFWLMSAFLFLFTLILMWLGQYKDFIDQKSGVAVADITAFGLMYELPGVLLLWFGILLPFLTVDLASSDVRRKTHELVMTCAISNRAFLWGRYLVGLCQCLFLTLLMLVAMVVMAFALHSFLWLGLDGPSDLIGYPEPNVGIIVFFWALMVLPIAVWFSAICFRLGSFNAQSIGMNQALMAGLWFLIWTFEFIFNGNPIASAFDPTSDSMSFAFRSFYMNRYWTLVQHVTNPDQRQAIGNAVQQLMPDTLWLFVLTHIIYALLGLVFVALSIKKFPRFANAL
ncbi:ABC transporter permease [Dictyobacter kobayashii]|uniref:ABC transporter permease n=1 Tax=Dictyobacter kobayashii TaxID=2014872 RepID=A0A402AEY7_9CHLR|nr:hypothetical protein [Dictyobacter kobayashii]GCE17644.1 hypothetical protein KDK_14440 [Dictyobacter kobayashii]